METTWKECVENDSDRIRNTGPVSGYTFSEVIMKRRHIFGMSFVSFAFLIYWNSEQKQSQINSFERSQNYAAFRFVTTLKFFTGKRNHHRLWCLRHHTEGVTGGERVENKCCFGDELLCSTRSTTSTSSSNCWSYCNSSTTSSGNSSPLASWMALELRVLLDLKY